MVGWGWPAPSGQEAFRWTSGGGMVGLGGLGSSSYAYDISADGSTVVGYAYSPSGKVTERTALCINRACTLTPV